MGKVFQTEGTAYAKPGSKSRYGVVGKRGGVEKRCCIEGRSQVSRGLAAGLTHLDLSSEPQGVVGSP